MTKEIQNAICKAEIQKDNLVAENFNYFFTGELDVISVNRSGYVSEFEVKVSRSDFKADAKKRKWQYFDTLIGRAIPNYFTYVCPEGMIKPEELKPYMGLIYYTEGQLTIIKRPVLIHKYKHDIIKLLTKLCRVNNWKAYFGAQKLTIQNREIRERNDATADIEWKKKMSEVNKHRNG